MFDIGATELLVIVIVAIIAIGPKDMPMALRAAGRWVGKIRRVSAHFRSGIDAMIREAELEEMEKKWKAQNEAIMARTPAIGEHGAEMTGPPLKSEEASAEARTHQPDADDPAPPTEKSPAQRPDASEPELPLGKVSGEG